MTPHTIEISFNFVYNKINPYRYPTIASLLRIDQKKYYHYDPQAPLSTICTYL